MTWADARGCKPGIGVLSIDSSDAPRLISNADSTWRAWTGVRGSAFGARFTGTGRVGERAHASSWEIFVVVEGKGWIDIEGASTPLRRGGIVAIAPKKKHSWKSDDGVELRGVVFFEPSGPERAFALPPAPSK